MTRYDLMDFDPFRNYTIGFDRILNRVDLWNSTMLDRIMKNTKSSRHTLQMSELREIVDSKYFFPDQE